MVKDINVQIQESQQIPSRVSTKKTTPSHIIVKPLETKKKINATTENNTLHIGGNDLIITDFSSDNNGRKEVLKEKETGTPEFHI